MSNEGKIKENKDNMVTLRLGDEQMQVVRQWAVAHDSNISEVIRSAIEYMTKVGARQ